MKRQFTDDELLTISKSITLVKSICDENVKCNDCILQNSPFCSPHICAQLEILLDEMLRRNKELNQGRL